MGGRSGWMREGGGAGAQVWKGGGTKHCEGQVAEGGLRGASVQEGRLFHRGGRGGRNGPRVVLERTKSRYLSKFRSSDSCGLCLFCGFRGDSNNRTECAVVLIRFANLKNEETNRNKDNCTFGSVV